MILKGLSQTFEMDSFYRDEVYREVACGSAP